MVRPAGIEPTTPDLEVAPGVIASSHFLYQTVANIQVPRSVGFHPVAKIRTSSLRPVRENSMSLELTL